MPPPNIFRHRCERAMKSVLPTSMEPIGAPNPFERQIATLSHP